MHLHPVAIGAVTIPNNVFLAPIAGVTDRSFRLIAREQGCGLVYSEMVSAKSIVYDNVHTRQLLDTCEQERPFAIQLFGHEPEVVAEALKRLEDCPFDIVDLNMGCPAPKIVRNGEGCALMTDPVLAGRIIEAASRATARPVTIKMRKGFTPAQANAVLLARVAQESGAAAVTVHGRTRDQYYAGTADWNIITAVKQAVHIPVIGNGDVQSAQAAARMFTETGCDAIMIARSAMGNPWIFKEILHYLETGEHVSPVDWDIKRETALRHARMVIAHKGEKTGALEMRKHLSWYARGLSSASKLRLRINTVTSYTEMETILDKYESP